MLPRSHRVQCRRAPKTPGPFLATNLHHKAVDSTSVAPQKMKWSPEALKKILQVMSCHPATNLGTSPSPGGKGVIGRVRKSNRSEKVSDHTGYLGSVSLV